MIRKLRIKIVAVITCAMLLVFSSVFATLNLFMYRDSARITDGFLRMVAEQDGFFLPPRDNFGLPRNARDLGNSNKINPEIMRAGRFFYVKVDKAGNIFEIDLNMMFDFSEENASEYALTALEKGRVSGRTGNFSYFIAEKSYGKIAVFAERSIEMGMLERLARTSVIVAGASCLIIFGLSVVASKWMIKPVGNAFEKQRRFTSDASHELKTPLTIMSANADILESEIGGNIRLNNIKAQITRMNALIHDLITLAKSDESGSAAVKLKFDLSRAVLNAVLEFESRAFEEGRKYEYNIEENLMFTGDEKQIRQVIAILIDNAIRHSGKFDEIKIMLSGEAGKARISVYNTGAGIPEGEADKIFGRFYRSDESRSRGTGGYGLGLAIAKAIVESHKGNIHVKGKQGKWVEFLIIL